MKSNTEKRVFVNYGLKKLKKTQVNGMIFLVHEFGDLIF